MMGAITRRKALAALAGTGALGIIAALPQCSGAAAFAANTDPMVQAVSRHRAWLEAYASADFGGSFDGEDRWLKSNPDEAGNLLHQDPPMPETLAGAIAAIRFVAEDEDFIERTHARILKQALAYLEARPV